MSAVMSGSLPDDGMRLYIAHIFGPRSRLHCPAGARRSRRLCNVISESGSVRGAAAAGRARSSMVRASGS